METVNSGIIGLYEARESLNAMKKAYRDEYRQLIRKEWQTNFDYFVNKWKVRFGTFAAQLGFNFAPTKETRLFGKIGVGVIGRITETVMRFKNKLDQKKYKKKKETLTADFINARGIFEQYSVENQTTIEEVSHEELTQGRSR